MITIVDIHEKIAAAIVNSKLSQLEIAKQLHVQPTQICAYIHGRKMPSLETFANLCDILMLDANEMLCLSSFDTNTNKPSKPQAPAYKPTIWYY